jgi:hypothetical protein
MEHEVNINEAFEKPTGGYGRIWESMYKGSMLGSGLEVFAVWPYVIANMRGHPEHGALVELNPELLAFMIGCEEQDVEVAINKLCAIDPESRTPTEDGKRLVKMGQFLYRVVNGGKYLAIRKAEADRIKNREAVQRHREKKKEKRIGPSNVERESDRLENAGKHEEAERMLEIEEQRLSNLDPIPKQPAPKDCAKMPNPQNVPHGETNDEKPTMPVRRAAAAGPAVLSQVPRAVPARVEAESAEPGVAAAAGAAIQPVGANAAKAFDAIESEANTARPVAAVLPGVMAKIKPAKFPAPAKRLTPLEQAQQLENLGGDAA